MKVLYIGGVKSGKSGHAERRTIALSDAKPYYLATGEAFDEEMRLRIEHHRAQRADSFVTIEEPLELMKLVARCDEPVLIECMTVWMANMLHHGYSVEEIVAEVLHLRDVEHDVVFVLNDVGGGIIPDNALSRTFADLSGIVAQRLAEGCDEVYHCIAGIATRIK